MKMKPRTYFGLALLFPYMLWGICALVVLILSYQEISEPWNIVLMPISFYAFGILLWFIPYTVLAVGMWIWGKNKSTPALRKLVMVAPIILFTFMLIEAILISLPTNYAFPALFLLGGFSLVFGYLCVGIAMGIFKILQAGGLIAEETPEMVSEIDQLPTLI